MIQAIREWPYIERRLDRNRSKQQIDWLFQATFLVRSGQGLGTIDNWLLNLRLLLFIRIKAQENFSILSIETGLLGEFSCYLSALEFSEDQTDSFSLVAWNCKASNPHPYF